MKSRIYLSIFMATLLAFTVPEKLMSESGDCQYERKVKTSKDYTLEIENKFGTITLINIKGDSLKACATVSIRHSAGSEMIQKSMDLVKVNITDEVSYLKFATSFDPKFFTKSYARGREFFSVNYIVEIPESVNVIIRNSYGNVFIPTLSGQFHLTLNNGEVEIDNLKRGNIKPVNTIDLVNSTSRIGKINWATISAKYTEECFVEEAEALAVKSILSNVTVLKCNNMVVNSKLGQLFIGKTEKVNIESDMTNTTIEMLTKGGQIATNMGEVNIISMGGQLKELTVAGNNTAFSVGLPKEGNPFVNASISAGPLKMASSIGQLTREKPDAIKSVINGPLKEGTVTGKITIIANGGSLKIY